MGISNHLPSLQLASHLKINLPNGKVVVQPSIFRGELLMSGRVRSKPMLPDKDLVEKVDGQQGTQLFLSRGCAGGPAYKYINTMGVFTFLHVSIPGFCYTWIFQVCRIYAQNQPKSLPKGKCFLHIWKI